MRLRKDTMRYLLGRVKALHHESDMFYGLAVVTTVVVTTAAQKKFIKNLKNYK